MIEMVKNNELLDFQNLTLQQQRQKQNEIIFELSNALRIYLQNGIENKLLQILIRSESMIDEHYWALRNEIKTILEEEHDSTLNIQETILGIMDDSAYLCQLKTMISTYYLEYRKREERSEFESYCSKELNNVVDAVGGKRVSFEMIETKKRIEQQQISDVIKAYSELFCLKQRDSQCTLSLTHKGHRYYNFISEPMMMDANTFRISNYKNCESIIHSFNYLIENDFNTPKALNLYGMTLMQEKAIKHQYSILTRKIKNIKRKDITIYSPNQLKNLEPNLIETYSILRRY